MVQRAVARGAVLLRLPRLFDQELAIRIESNSMLFGEAGREPLEGETSPLNTFDRFSVRYAVQQLETVFAPVAGWLL